MQNLLNFESYAAMGALEMAKRVRGSVVALFFLVFAVHAAEDYTTWTYHQTLVLNTSASGANITGTVTSFPVLVRLTAANFSGFGSVAPLGADIRFSKSNYAVQLPYQIQRWNATNGAAEIWVLVDTIAGGSSTQSIVMHYGKSGAASQSNGPAVFSPANNFVAVWHGSDTSDASGNGYTLIKSGTLAKTVGLIDSCYSFTGSQYLSNASQLGHPATLTVSCWANVTGTTDENLVTIANAVGLRGGNGTATHVMSYEYGANTFEDYANAPTMSGKGWTYVAGVFNPPASSESYYFNGAVPAGLTSVNGMGTSNRAIVYTGTGTDSITALGAIRVGTTPYYLTGSLDEIRVEKVARSANWMALCFANQQANQKLVTLTTLIVNSPVTLLSPANGATGQSTSPTLAWNTASGATSYSLQVSHFHHLFDRGLRAVRNSRDFAGGVRPGKPDNLLLACQRP